MKKSLAFYGAILSITTIMAAEEQQNETTFSEETVITMLANEFPTIENQEILKHLCKRYNGDTEQIWSIAQELSSNDQPVSSQEQVEKSKQEQVVKLLKKCHNKNEKTIQSNIEKICKLITTMNAQELKWLDAVGQTFFHHAILLHKKINDKDLLRNAFATICNSKRQEPQWDASAIICHLRTQAAKLGCADLINQESDDGLTPLHLAASNPEMSIILALTKKDSVLGSAADATATTPQGLSVLDILFSCLNDRLNIVHIDRINGKFSNFNYSYMEQARWGTAVLLVRLQDQLSDSSNNSGTSDSENPAMVRRSTILMHALDKSKTANQESKKYLSETLLATLIRSEDNPQTKHQMMERHRQLMDKLLKTIQSDMQKQMDEAHQRKEETKKSSDKSEISESETSSVTNESSIFMKNENDIKIIAEVTTKITVFIIMILLNLKFLTGIDIF